MKTISKILVVLMVSLSTLNSYAQIKNLQTATLKISGTCEMCEGAILKAANVKNIAQVSWNKDTKMATLNYDSKKTGEEEILKRVALAGYDNERFLAPGDAYAKLPQCCQYTRVLKPAVNAADMQMQANNGNDAPAQQAPAPNTAQLQAVFDSYFSLNEALINTDAGSAAQKATLLATAIKAVEMNKLSAREHDVWMKVMKDILANAESVSALKDIAKQRTVFALLSKNIYDLASVYDFGSPVYYQHCPMYNNGKGANWLSKDSEIKNPYYGSMMLNCGQTVETLK